MLWFRKRKKTNYLCIPRLRLQIEMVQQLLADGYNWDQIFNAIGFSEVWYNSTLTYIAKSQNKK